MHLDGSPPRPPEAGDSKADFLEVVNYCHLLPAAATHIFTQRQSQTYFSSGLDWEDGEGI